MEVGLSYAEFDDIGKAADQIGLPVLLLYVGEDGVEAVQVVLPVLREELAHSLLGEELLHESRLLYVLALYLLDLEGLSGFLLTELLERL